MERFLISSAICIVLAIPAMAADLPYVEEPLVEDMGELLRSGMADVWLGYVWINVDENDDDIPKDTGRAGGQGLLNIPFAERFSMQLDISSEGDFKRGFDSANANRDYEGQILGGVHLSYRDPTSYLFGAFAGVGEAFLGNGGTQKDETGWMFGLEGQFYLDRTTFYAQGGYYGGDNNDPGKETMEEAWFVKGVVRHFFTPNTLISGELMYGWGHEGGSIEDDINFAGWELLLKQQFGTSAFSAFAAYDGHFVEIKKMTPGSSDEHLYEHAAKIGISFAFGAPDLLAQDRYGATLSLPADPLRASAYTADVVD